MKKLILNKETISHLNNKEMAHIKGGGATDWNCGSDLCTNSCQATGCNRCTAGCTDGCTSIPTINTHFNCTQANCSGDCKVLKHG